MEKIATGQAEISKDVVATWQKRSSNLRDLLGRPSTESLQLAYSYLEWVLSDVAVMLIVENSQLIDAESFHFICALAQENGGLRLVFEYTTGASGPGVPFRKYEDFLQACRDRSLNVAELPVLAIDFDALAHKNFQSEDPKLVEILRRELTARGGNVRDLERLHEVTSKSIATLAALSTVTIEGALASIEYPTKTHPLGHSIVTQEPGSLRARSNRDVHSGLASTIWTYRCGKKPYPVRRAGTRLFCN